MISRGLLRQTPSFPHAFGGGSTELTTGETSEWLADKNIPGGQWDNVSLKYVPSSAALLRSSFDNQFLGHRLIGLFSVAFVGKMPATNCKFPQQRRESEVTGS